MPSTSFIHHFQNLLATQQSDAINKENMKVVSSWMVRPLTDKRMFMLEEDYRPSLMIWIWDIRYNNSKSLTPFGFILNIMQGLGEIYHRVVEFPPV